MKAAKYIVLNIFFVGFTCWTAQIQSAEPQAGSLNTIQDENSYVPGLDISFSVIGARPAVGRSSTNTHAYAQDQLSALRTAIQTTKVNPSQGNFGPRDEYQVEKPRPLNRAVYPSNGLIRLVSGYFKMQEPVPEQPPTPQQPPTLPPTTTPGAAQPELASAAELERAALAELRASAVPSQSTTQEKIASAAPTDLAGALSQSSEIQGVEVQRRSPVALDPHIRGYKVGQIYTQADGAYWIPARTDMDTILSKIDPGMIRNVTVLPGPYGVQYGPGLAFIDVQREPAPRYDCYETHFDTTGNIRTNGGQVYGRETVYGGNSNWGFRMSYGDRAGSDYRSGDNILIPSGYHNRDAVGDLSFDLNPYQHIDISYNRLDQTDTEYPCQFFDVNALTSYGFNGRIVDEDPSAPWSRLLVEGWYNRTYFRGDTTGKTNNPDFTTIQWINDALDLYYASPGHNLYGATTGNAASAGTRIVTTLGDKDDAHVNVGGDFRYLEQYIREDFTINEYTTPIDSFYDNMPHSWMLDPGMFVDWTKPVTDNWTVTAGARMDFLGTKAREGDLRPNSMLSANELTQSDVLYAFYLNNKWKLDENWSLGVSFGHGQRSPTLIERYSDGLFISSSQSGYTRMIGDPNLAPERDWQVDVGLGVNHDRWRSNVNLYHAWIFDYITLQDESVFNFMDARLLQYTNTSLATLVGFDWQTEIDLYPRLSPFATMSYVEGRDQEINQPLPAISPLESTVGFRLHNPEKNRNWQIEMAARIVDNQNRLGTIRWFGSNVTTIEERTPGFVVWHLRGYWNYTKNFRLIAGIDNLFNRNYQEHLDLRLHSPSFIVPAQVTRVLSPGITPYFGLNWVY
jgi:iron complex outermembrane receptor protein